MALSSSDAADHMTEEQRQYSERCAVLREERQQRGAVLAEAAAAWAVVSTACINECVAAWAEYEARWRASLTPPPPPQPLYLFQFHAGTTESVLPVGKAGDGARALLRGGGGAPANAAVAQLSQWEQENRADLEAWERVEGGQLAGAMLHILNSQHQRDVSIRKRACRRVLSSATALEWMSYPKYRESRMLS